MLMWAHCHHWFGLRRQLELPAARTLPIFARAGEETDAMLDALFRVESGINPNTEEPSHLHVERAEDGEPVQARFVYVDEPCCIGCTYCASIARSTFFMEDDHGRARVYNQGGDSLEVIDEAIDSCPVNCIHFVSWEDLIILETERAGQVINNAARLRSQQECTSGASITDSKATFFDSGSMRCNNCPGRGCKECPMFGVGKNPVYLERQAAREERRRLSGQAQAAEEEQRREALIDNLFVDFGEQAGFLPSEQAGLMPGGAADEMSSAEPQPEPVTSAPDDLDRQLDMLFAAEEVTDGDADEEGGRASNTGNAEPET